VLDKLCSCLSQPSFSHNSTDASLKLYNYLKDKEPDQIGLLTKLYTICKKKIHSPLSESSKGIFKRLLSSLNILSQEVLNKIEFADIVMPKTPEIPDLQFLFSSNIGQGISQ
jgi:hypothetical protein